MPLRGDKGISGHHPWDWGPSTYSLLAWQKNFKTKLATFSPDENSKNEKLRNWIELPNPGLAKDLNKIGVTRMKDFKLKLRIYPSSTLRVFKRRPRFSMTGKYLFVKKLTIDIF